MLTNYINRINQSADITRLIGQLENERDYSYTYTLHKEGMDSLNNHRYQVDSLINKLASSTRLFEFQEYAFQKW